MPANDVNIQTINQWVNDGGKLNLNAMRPVMPSPGQKIKRNSRVAQNALLRKGEWELIDRAVIDIARTSLVGIADLMNLGLTADLGDMGTIYSVYEQLTDMSAADIDMAADTPGKEDRVGFNPVTLPVPIIHKDFRVNKRHLLASRRIGASIDTTQVATATRKVRDALEALLFNGTGAPTVDGNTFYGYTNHPKRLTAAASAYGGGDFDTENNGYKTLNGALAALEAIGFYGPFGVYVAGPQYAQIRKRQTDGSGDSEVNSIMKGLPQISFIKRSDSLAAAATVVVQLTRDVVDLGIAEDIAAIQWSEEGGMVTRFKVMAVMVPRLKYDSNNNMGLCHITAC